jgi:hypothetical protein
MARTGRRLALSAVAAVAGITLAAAPASAHFCYKKNVNERAAAGMGGSANWVSFEDMATEFLGPLCDEGIEMLADAGGVTPDTLIDSHGTMAGGTLKKAEPGNRAIGYLDFEALDAAVPAAFEACGLEPPAPPA